MKERNKIINGIIALGIGTITNILISVLTTPIITRLVSPESYGKWSIFTMYTNMALLFFCLGLDQAIIRFFYDENALEYKRGLIKTCVMISVLVTVVAELVFFVGVHFKLINFEFEGLIFVLLLCNVFINVVNRMSMIVLRIDYKNKQYSMCIVFTKVLFTLIALVGVLYFQGNQVLILCIATVVSFIFPTIISIWMCRDLWNFKNIKGVENVEEILRYSFPYIISMGITTLFQSIDKISLNRYCSYADVGIYTSAYTIVNIFAIVQSVFNTIWAPIQVEHYMKKPNDRAFFSKVNAYLTLVMFSMGILLIVFKDLIVFLLGSEYRDSAYIIPFLAFNPIMYTISETTNTGIEISKKSYLHIIVGALSCTVNICGNTLLVPILGGRGAAISTGLSYVVFWLSRTVFSLKYFKVDYHLFKFVILTFLMIVYASISTFVKFGWGHVFMSFVLFITLIVMYKKDVIDLLKLLVAQIKR